ncbi:hypothetical protein L873DRAFT_47782 [Choiromyces venosus 120613-1]|uniref:Uncharacterized protein n=1 Tax=Choiromyces venosus 120613-1 TaxID=1336337 RepID=A0A3N4K6J3_9PEZI|nr:hypothetical protein L873DRAFT_47782 [Choiromyces venosus 120613-1]
MKFLGRLETCELQSHLAIPDGQISWIPSGTMGYPEQRKEGFISRKWKKNEKKGLFPFSYEALSQKIFIRSIDTSCRPFSRHTCMIACSSSSCSSLFVPIYYTSLYLPSYPLEHSLPSSRFSLFLNLHFWPRLLASFGIASLTFTAASGSVGQLSIGTRGGFLRISYESETSPFPVQRVKFYDDSEVPEILYGSARYPVQRDPG